MTKIQTGIDWIILAQKGLASKVVFTNLKALKNFR